jgi:hypothetical protein
MDPDYNHYIHDIVYYSMVESKELIFFSNEHQKITFMRNDFSRDCSFEIILLYTKKSKNYGTTFIKMLLFQNLGSQ